MKFNKTERPGLITYTVYIINYRINNELILLYCVASQTVLHRPCILDESFNVESRIPVYSDLSPVLRKRVLVPVYGEVFRVILTILTMFHTVPA